MTTRKAQHAALVGEIYLGSQSSLGWNLALQMLADLVGAEFGFLIECGLDGNERTLIAATDLNWVGLDSDLDYWQQARNKAMPRPNLAKTTPRRLTVSGLVQGACVDDGPGHYRAGDAFVVGDHHIATCWVTRAANNGPFRPRDLKLIEAIVPHMQRAMNMRAVRLDGERSTNEIMGAMQAHGWGVAAISVEGKVLSTNQSMKDLLLRSSDLAMLQETLVFVDDSMRSSYDELLQSLLSPIVNSRRATGTPITVRVGHGHSVRGVQIGSFGAHIWCLPPDSRAMLLFIPHADEHSPENELFNRYACTPTESEVAMAMLNGTRPDAIAKDRGVSLSTIRGHIKRIYAKLGVNRHQDLIVRLRRLS